MLGFERITFDPDVMGGRACVRGMRVTVSLVLNLIASGMSTEKILETYPYLEAEDISECLRYAAYIVDRRCRIFGGTILGMKFTRTGSPLRHMPLLKSELLPEEGFA